MSSAHDPISDVIGLLRPRRLVVSSVYASVPWSVRFDPFPHVKLGGIVRGECWLALEGLAPVLLRQGDFYLLANPPRYVMASALTLKPRPAKPLWAAAGGTAVRIGPPADDETSICGGHFAFDDPNAPLLLDVLPVLTHVPAGDPRGALLEHLSQLLVSEVQSDAVGGALVLDRLAQVLFVHMLRAHAQDPSARAVGWLGALGDERIGAALRAMHADVARRWTLGELADVARMSRSAFAASFRSQVGRAPLDYLIQWRMSLARDALRRDTSTISELAFRTGYESESAFSTAFRRVVGSSPKQFRDQTRAVAG